MKNKSIAVVQFPSGHTNCHFKNHIEDLSIGDQVVCDTAQGLSVGRVTGLKEHSAQATKWIVQKIDLVEHAARVEKQKHVDVLKKKMEQRRKEIQDVQVYALLAQSDPEMADMLKQLLVLEGKASV